jgi:hypothetical protein
MYYNFLHYMRHWIIVILLFLISGCRPSEIPVNLIKDLDSISARWVPDKREGISNFSLKKSLDGKLVLKGETDLPGLKSEFISYLSRSSVEYIDSMLILPDTTIIHKPWGLVSVGVCNIKGSPSHSSEMVSQAVMGTPVKILKKRGGWLLIQTPDYYIGWANDSGISEFSGKEIETWRKAGRLIYTGKLGDILSEIPGEAVISDIVSGAILVKTGETGNFYTTTLPDGRTGLVPKDVVADINKWCSEVTPDAGKLILFSKALIGYPYLWGGTSTKAIDCSGFVKTIYFMGGIILARDASQQFLHGSPVDISVSYDSLIPGDLLYFGHKNSAGAVRITHTGMYLGDTEVIHSSGMVQISSLDSTRPNYSPYLKETIMGARRVIGGKPQRGIEPVRLHSWYNDLK